MKWTDLLKKEAEDAYRMALGLVKMVDDDKLGWKPETGANWMTTGQLLKHMVGSCGACCKGVVTGDWGIPCDEMPESEEAMLPPAEALPAVASVKEALDELEADRKVALEIIDQAGEEALETKEVTLPWGSQAVIGKHCLDMINHLNNHKQQLFYYLKLQGKQVDTHHMYGMVE